MKTSKKPKTNNKNNNAKKINNKLIVSNKNQELQNFHTNNEVIDANVPENSILIEPMKNIAKSFLGFTEKDFRPSYCVNFSL